MYDAHARTRTRERAVRGHGKKWPTPVVDGTGRAPWKTGQNPERGPTTSTDPSTTPETGCTWTREKNGRRPSWTERDARHGKLGKTMYDAHARTRTRERAVRGHGKKRPTPVVDGT